MYIITNDGCFNSGKTTVYDGVKENLGDKEQYYFVDEFATKYIQEKGKRPYEMTKKEIADMQMEIIDHNLDQEKRALDEYKLAIMDSSVISALAYAQDVFSKKIYHMVEQIVAARAPYYKTLLFEPHKSIKLQNNGVRHVNDENHEEMLQFQNVINERIKQILKQHNIAYYAVRELGIKTRIKVATQKIEHVYKDMLSFEDQSKDGAHKGDQNNPN